MLVLLFVTSPLPRKIGIAGFSLQSGLLTAVCAKILVANVLYAEMLFLNPTAAAAPSFFYEGYSEWRD